MKICTGCGKCKHLNDFTINRRAKDGHNHRCKTCTRAASKQYGDAHPDKARERGQAWYQNNKDRRREATKRWLDNNRERYNAWQREHRDNDAMRAYMKNWDAANRHKRKAYYEENKDAFLIKWAMRNAAKLQATPIWASRSKIADLYKLARRISRELGVKHNVDHIVPLKHPLVCGLHWEGNMRIVTETVNKSKGNRYWPDMPE